MNCDFTQAIQDAGGSHRAYAKAIRAETQELFDCSVDELYEATGGKKGDRSTLPKEAQKAYMVSETLATHQLRDTRTPNTSPDTHIVKTVAKTAQQVRHWLPW